MPYRHSRLSFTYAVVVFICTEYCLRNKYLQKRKEGSKQKTEMTDGEESLSP